MNFQEFNLKSMVDSPLILIVGKRGSGKSILARDILNSCKDKVSNGIVISPKDKIDGLYSSFISDLFIYDDFQPGIINLFRQKMKMTKKNMFVVMDDCLKKNWHNDPAVSNLFFSARHYYTMYILIMQFPLGIKPELRCNFDYIFLFYDDDIKNQKRIYDHYAGMFPNFESFQQIYKQLTENYGAMVIVNRGIKTDIYKKIFHYKAKHENENYDINIGDDEIVI